MTLKYDKHKLFGSKLKVALCLIAIVVTLAPTHTVKAQNNQLLIDFPTPPEQITRLDERCNYIVDNFWKRLNFKGAFSSIDRLDATMGQFFSVTPFATADTVHMAIDRLITGVAKSDAKNLVTLAKIAEKWCATDSAEYPSEELMLPFAQAVASSKKIKGPEKDYYTQMAKRMSNSRIGVVPADFTFTVPDGSIGRFSEITAPTVLIFFYDPDDFDNRLARTRLGNDFVVKTLIEHNLLRVLALYPGKPDQKWQSDIESIPDQWIIGAAPGIEELFSIKKNPQLYFLDEDRMVTDKDFSVDAAIIYFNQFLKRTKAD